jgi:hypothetical protein
VQSGIVSQGAVDERCIELDLDLPPATELAHIALDSSEYCIWDAPDIKKKMPDLPVLQMGAVQFVVGSLGLGSRPALGLDLLPFQLAGLFYDPVSIVYRKDLGLIREGELRYLGNNHAGVAISEPLQVPAGLYFIDLNIRTTILQPIRHLNTSRLFFAIDDAKARINSYLVLPQFRVLDSSNQYLSIPCPTYPPPVNFLPTTNPTTSNLQAAKKKVVTKKAPKKRVKAKKIRGKTKKQ